jgi:hypothetical protein
MLASVIPQKYTEPLFIKIRGLELASLDPTAELIE